nr:hypothetical protein [Rhodoferax sp.]
MTAQALLLTNVGGFLPGRVEDVIDQDAPLEIYRNPYLAEAMVMTCPQSPYQSIFQKPEVCKLT